VNVYILSPSTIHGDRETFSFNFTHFTLKKRNNKKSYVVYICYYSDCVCHTSYHSDSMFRVYISEQNIQFR
jgi:hypothetical protein